MRKLLILLLIPFSVAGQAVEGTVVYEQIVGVDRNFERPGSAQQPPNPRFQAMMENVPKEGLAQHTLVFTASEALYTVGETDFGEIDVQTQKIMGFMRRVRPPKEKWIHIYTNLESGTRLDHFEFMTREFLVEASPTIDWKMVPERKKVLEFVCMGASTTEGDKEVIAWFSPEIPVSAGPGHYTGLPGLILAIEIDGEITQMATAINLEKLQGPIEQPAEGQKVSQEKFDEIKAEKTKEHRARLEQMRQNRQMRGGGSDRGAGRGKNN